MYLPYVLLETHWLIVLVFEERKDIYIAKLIRGSVNFQFEHITFIFFVKQNLARHDGLRG